MAAAVPAINALGYGGQLIAIVPDANAVIVLASTVADPNNPILDALRENLLPMLRRQVSARQTSLSGGTGASFTGIVRGLPQGPTTHNPIVQQASP